MRSSWAIQVGSESSDVCPDNRQKRRRRHTADEAMCRWKQGQEQCCYKPSMPGAAGSWGSSKKRFSLGALRRNHACPHVDFRRLASSTVRDRSPIVLSHPVCGPMLQQPQETEAEAQPALELRPSVSWEVMHVECLTDTQ